MDTTLTLAPYTLKQLYDMTNEVYIKKYNRYVNTWYKEIMDASKIGEFEVTLFVCDWDCDEGEARVVVTDALDRIKELFKGINIEEDGDNYLVYYNVSWNADDLKEDTVE